VASIGGRIAKERGPPKGQITTVTRGGLPAYSVTPGKDKVAAVDIEDYVPSSGRPNNRQVGRISAPSRGAKRC